jgi:hypothetical protein
MARVRFWNERVSVPPFISNGATIASSPHRCLRWRWAARMLSIKNKNLAVPEKILKKKVKASPMQKIETLTSTHFLNMGTPETLLNRVGSII